MAYNKLSSIKYCAQTSPRKRPVALWFDSCKRPPPVRDHQIFAFWVLAYGRFDCIKLWLLISLDNFAMLLVVCQLSSDFNIGYEDS